MTWTKNKPEKCGYYWVYAEAPHHTPRILRFVIMEKLFGQSWHIQPQDGPRSTEGWSWFAGPIDVPHHACTHPRKPVCCIADEYHCPDCGASVPDPTEIPTKEAA